MRAPVDDCGDESGTKPCGVTIPRTVNLPSSQPRRYFQLRGEEQPWCFDPPDPCPIGSAAWSDSESVSRRNPCNGPGRRSDARVIG